MLMAIALVVFSVQGIGGLALTLFQTRFSFSVAHRLSGIMWTYHFSQNLEQLRREQSGPYSCQRSMAGQAFCQYDSWWVVAADYGVFRGRDHIVWGFGIRARGVGDVAYPGGVGDLSDPETNR